MICDLDTKMWGDEWFQGLRQPAKLLFIYLWGNDHKNLPCIYEITKKTISDGSGFTVKEVGKLLSELSPKVKYDEQANLVWVVNNVRRQYLKSVKVSPKIVKGIENALCLLPHGHPFIEEFLNKYSILNITYPYPFGGYLYPPGEEEGVGKGEGGDGESLKEVILYKGKMSSEQIASPEFIQTWERWVKHRREIKKPLTPTQAESQLKKMSSMGFDRSIAMMEHTIEKGWQGLREPDMSNKQSDPDAQFRARAKVIEEALDD